MDRKQKEETVAALKRTFEESEIVVVTHYSGLTVADLTDLRGRMRAAGATFKVTKNRLTRRAIEGTPFAELSGLFVGPTAIAYSGDPVAAAKAAVGFAKDNDKLVILGGLYDGQNLDVNAVEELARLLSLDEIRAAIISMLQTPARRIATVLQAPASQVARVIGAYGESRDANAETSAETAAETVAG